MNTTTFQWPVRVYYEDTDAGGVVYHASYVAFYERARTEMLRYHGISQQSLLNDRIAFVVRRLTVEYFSPAHLDDMLSVYCEVIALTRASLLFSQRIIRADNQLINTAEVKIVCVDSVSMKPRRIPNLIIPELTP